MHRTPPSKPYTFLTEQQNPRSTTGLLALGEFGRQVFHYKIGDSENLRSEGNELVRAAIATQSIQGVQPIVFRMFDAEHGMLITEHVTESESLFNYLWNGTGSIIGATKWITSPDTVGYRLGSWLRAYHDSTLAQGNDSHPALASVRKRAWGKLRAIQKAAPGALRLSTTKQLTNCLQVNPAADACLETAIVHGDMDPANVLVHRKTGALFIVDFADCRREHPFEDVARLWHGLWGMAQLSKRRRPELVRCREEVLRGYGLSPHVLREPAFRLCRCYNAITIILMYYFLRGKVGFFDRRRLRLLTQQSSRWLESQSWNLL